MCLGGGGGGGSKILTSDFFLNKQQFSNDIFVNCYTMYFLVMYSGYADCGVIN